MAEIAKCNVELLDIFFLDGFGVYAQSWHKISAYIKEQNFTDAQQTHGGEDAQICPICDGRGWNSFTVLSVSASKEPINCDIKRYCDCCQGTGKLHHV